MEQKIKERIERTGDTEQRIKSGIKLLKSNGWNEYGIIAYLNSDIDAELLV